MKKFDVIKAHLADNTGDENVSKLIWIVIAFVLGALLLGIMRGVFEGGVSTWLDKRMADWFGDNTGAIASPANPT